jgi:hypothetical protein
MVVDHINEAEVNTKLRKQLDDLVNKQLLPKFGELSRYRPVRELKGKELVPS